MKFSLRFGIQFLNILSKTWRIEVKGELPENPAVIAFWHGQMLPGWKLFDGQNPTAIVSTSKDGAILTNLLEKWGFEVARGSSSKSGSVALRQMIRFAEKRYVLITPDGPRGPKNKMKAGAVITAMRAQVPLILLRINIHKSKVFDKSWDDFELPLPFSKVTIQISEKIYIDKELNKEEVNEKIIEIEKQLNL